jgi:UDP-N-acetylglucosamine 2-epimerase (non-hydrolysing)
VARKLIAYVVGARPNYMKVAPVWAALEGREGLDQRLIHTGQHYERELRDIFFPEFSLPAPHVQLDAGSGTHGEQTARALVGVERVLIELRPDLVVVAGDVNSTLAGALAAVKVGIPVCHIESGLRSDDWTMPEEHNRRIADHLSTLLLTHCEDANRNLAAEGIPSSRVAFVGNTMIDTLVAKLDDARAVQAWRAYGLEPGGYVLVTLHRPAPVDLPELLRETLAALGRLGRALPVLFPVHPRTRLRIEQLDMVPAPGVTLLPPLPYTAFLSLEAAAAAVITDSGGIQEETTALGVRCFTLRDNTERPVTVSDGTNELLGLEPGRIVDVPRLLAEPREARVPPLWDGRAGDRAADEIVRLVGEPVLRLP